MHTETPSLIIGIGGGSGSGKTTVANEILNRVGAHHIVSLPHDAYYKDLRDLPPNLREQVNFDHPLSLETDLLTEHILQLKAGHTVDLPIYDFTTHTRTDRTIELEPRRVILVEGILIFGEVELRRLMDIKLYVDTAPDIRFIRRLERDLRERGRTVDSVIHQYLTTVRPMHLKFVEPAKRYADIIIPRGGFNVVALDVVVARIHRLLSEADAGQAGRKRQGAEADPPSPSTPLEPPSERSRT